MRLTHLAATLLAAISAAAVAQVASTPVEQKTPMQPSSNTTDDAPSPTATATTGTPSPVETTTEAPANAKPAAGDPAAATDKPPK